MNKSADGIKSVYLKKDREKSLLRHHPWVFSGGIHRKDHGIQNGDVIKLCTSEGTFLAWGAYNGQSQIAVRVYSFVESIPFNETLVVHRISSAIQFRKSLYGGTLPSVCRLVFSESDLLSGLIADKFGDVLSYQLHALALHPFRDAIVSTLLHETGCKTAVDRSESGALKLEGLPKPDQQDTYPGLIEIEESGMKLLVDVHQGHKTGFYLDQRENRSKIAQYAKDASVLNCFSYTGGFGISAAKHGAKKVVNIEASASANAIAQQAAALNQISSSVFETITGDVFQVLRTYAAEGKTFDVLVLDPPKFAESKQHVVKAARGYKDINRIGFQLLNPGGILITFSCSGHIEAPLFQKIVADAALDAGVEAAVIEHLGQSPDHPIHLAVPETAYLKGLVCKKLM